MEKKSYKEKAKELVEKYICYVDVLHYDSEDNSYIHESQTTLSGAKKLALITVEELIKEQTMWQNGEINPILFWQEVKKEICDL